MRAERNTRMSTLDREQYDGVRLQALMNGGGLAAPEARKHLAREYPKSTAEVVQELNYRGFDASEWKTEMFCRHNKSLAPRVVGGSRAWDKVHIDDFAEWLRSHGDFTVAALYRQEVGISWFEEREILRKRGNGEASHVQ